MRTATQQDLARVFSAVEAWHKANEARVTSILQLCSIDEIERQAGIEGRDRMYTIISEYRKLLRMLKKEYGLRGIGDIPYLSPNIVLPIMIAEQIKMVERALSPSQPTTSE